MNEVVAERDRLKIHFWLSQMYILNDDQRYKATSGHWFCDVRYPVTLDFLCKRFIFSASKVVSNINLIQTTRQFKRSQ